MLCRYRYRRRRGRPLTGRLKACWGSGTAVWGLSERASGLARDTRSQACRPVELGASHSCLGGAPTSRRLNIQTPARHQRLLIGGWIKKAKGVDDMFVLKSEGGEIARRANVFYGAFFIITL